MGKRKIGYVPVVSIMQSATGSATVGPVEVTSNWLKKKLNVTSLERKAD